MTRSNWTTASLAFVAGAAVAGMLLVTPSADAANGSPIIAGQENGETNATTVRNTATVGRVMDLIGADGGLFAEGGAAGSTGVIAFGEAFGVQAGAEADGGTGVLGFSDRPTGIGVHGTTSGSGSGVFGEATGGGVAVNGLSSSGTAVEAQSGNGTALRVVGKASFSRSGVVTVPAGTTSRTVTLAKVTAGSMVLVTAQQVSTAFVKAAVPAAGKFVIQLSGPAPSGGLKVAYFVLN